MATESVRLRSSFTEVDPFSVIASQRHAATFVTEVTNETRKAIKAIITRSIEEGIAPKDAAKLVRSVVGLTSKQAIAVASHYSKLLTGGSTVASAHAKSAKYSDKLLKFRAETIARTEIMRAQNSGQQAAWDDAVVKGRIGGKSMKRWIVAPDDRLCPICASISGEEVPIDGVFSLGVEVPPAHPRCRCTIGLVPARPAGRVSAAPRTVAEPVPGTRPTDPEALARYRAIDAERHRQYRLASQARRVPQGQAAIDAQQAAQAAQETARRAAQQAALDTAQEAVRAAEEAAREALRQQAARQLDEATRATDAANQRLVAKRAEDARRHREYRAAAKAAKAQAGPSQASVEAGQRFADASRTARTVSEAAARTVRQAEIEARRETLPISVRRAEGRVRRAAGRVARESQLSQVEITPSLHPKPGTAVEHVMQIHEGNLRLITKDRNAMAVMKQADVKMALTNGSVTTHPSMARWRGVRPRGWPAGSTWDEIEGVYNTSNRLIISGRGRGGTTGSTLAHETGHGVDHAMQILRKRPFLDERVGRSWQKNIMDNPTGLSARNSYFRQTTPASTSYGGNALVTAGAEEAFAESWSMYTHYGFERVEHEFGKGWTATFKRLVADIQRTGRQLRTPGFVFKEVAEPKRLSYRARMARAKRAADAAAKGNT